MKNKIQSTPGLNLPVAILLFGWGIYANSVAQTEPDFNRDVRPILAAKCFACHGPDEEAREADLRLDDRDSALEYEALVPGKSGDSELMVRVLAKDDSRMPPVESGESLTDEEVAVLKAWIDAGAGYEQHWAFVPPQKPTPPDLNNLPQELGEWNAHPIDRFVLQRLLQNGKRPAPPADRYTLVRRLYLDLTGLPPTPEQADEFVNSKDPGGLWQIGRSVARLQCVW